MHGQEQPPALTEISPAMSAWDREFRLAGAVRIGQNTKAVTAVVVLVALSIAAGLYFGIRDGGSVDALGIVILLIVVAIIAVPALYYFLSFRKKAVVVEADGVRLTNGYLLPWAGIEHAGIWSYRGNTSVCLELDEDTMRAYQAQQSAAARMLTKANAGITRSRAVYLPGTLNADSPELADWLNLQIEKHSSAQRVRDPFQW